MPALLPLPDFRLRNSCFSVVKLCGRHSSFLRMLALSFHDNASKKLCQSALSMRFLRTVGSQKLAQRCPRRRPPIGSGLIWSAERRNERLKRLDGQTKAAKVSKRRPRYGAVESAMVHSFDLVDQGGGVVKIEPSQKSTPKSSPAPQDDRAFDCHCCQGRRAVHLLPRSGNVHWSAG